MTPADNQRRRIRLGIVAFAVVLVALVGGLGALGVDRRIVQIVGIAAALFIGMVWLTFRAFERIAATAAAEPAPSPSGDKP